MSEIFQFLSLGGVLMIPIGLCAVVGLTIFIERYWLIRSKKVLPPQFVQRIERLIQEKRWKETTNLCASSESAYSAVVQGGLRYAGQGQESVRAGMEVAGRRVNDMLERYLGLMGAAASVAPLLGLLGTVTGMIQVFQEAEETLRLYGDVQPAQLASGIWTALMTTAAGLTVAIPIFLGFKFLEGKIDRIVSELEIRSEAIVDQIAESSEVHSERPEEVEAQPLLET